MNGEDRGSQGMDPSGTGERDSRAGMDETIPRLARETASNWAAVLMHPAGFFSGMPRTGGYLEPLAFAVAAGLAAGIVRMVLGLAGWGFYMTTGGAVLALVLTPLFVGIGSFIGGGIFYLIWQAMGSKASFETAYRCAAYVTAIAPAAAVIRLIPYAGGVIALAWGCWLLAIASEKVHGIDRNKTLLVFGIIFAVLAVLGLVSEYHARHLVYALGNWRIHIGGND